MKAVSPENYVIRPFKTHKSQTYSYAFLGGSNPNVIQIDIASEPPASWTWNSTDQTNADGLYKRNLYATVQSTFYRSDRYWKNSAFYPTGSEFYVISVAQPAYGEELRPNSVILESPSTTATLQDDGRGQIVNSANTSSVIGNIFYSLGIIILQQSTGSATIAQDGIYLTTGSQIEVSFDATHTIYEHQIICTMEQNEFNYSTNPSMQKTGSGGGRLFNDVLSGSLSPYMTHVGGYNDLGELLVIGKFPRPIKRVAESQQSIIIRFDA